MHLGYERRGQGTGSSGGYAEPYFPGRIASQVLHQQRCSIDFIEYGPEMTQQHRPQVIGRYAP